MEYLYDWDCPYCPMAGIGTTEGAANHRMLNHIKFNHEEQAAQDIVKHVHPRDLVHSFGAKVFTEFVRKRI